MNWIEMVGHAGSLLSSLTFVPQVYQTWKTKSAKDLNLSMMLIVFASTIIWIVYGCALQLTPVVICNSFICALSAVLLYFKFRFDRK